MKTSLPKNDSEYTCAYCKGTFCKGWSDEEAEEEYKQNFSGAVARQEPKEVICDDCYKKLNAIIPAMEQ